ncbi:MAG: linked oxidase domain protein [Geminicoccaceae bacterium]|nr:linked oxidase domain protein [Geminicoccaceae bacterium]
MLPHPALRGAFRSDLRARAAYSEGAGIYRIIPEAVARPADVEDLKQLISWAAQRRISLIPRGAGSAMAGGNVGEGVVVDLTGLSSPFHIDPATCRATTGAAVTLAQLNTAAAGHGLRLPPDPSSGRWATLGGMVSTNAAGARSVRYGSVRRWVQALRLLSADGEELLLRRGELAADSDGAALSRLNRDVVPRIHAAADLIASRYPKTRKNSSGYALDAYLASGDIVDLVIGAEGTLGIVTEIEWRLDPVPPFRAGLRVHLASLDRLSDVVGALRAGTPGGFSEAFVPEAILLVELERSDPEVLRQVLASVSAAIEHWTVSLETAYSPPEAERLWAIRHAASPILAALPEDRRSLQIIEDACVPVPHMGEYIRAVRRLAAERGLPVVMFGHAGDGHIHVNLLPDPAAAGWQQEVAGLLEEVTAVVIDLGGTPSGEHGDGRLRAGTLRNLYGPEIMDLFGEVKRAFDPLGIFNPGIILPSGEPPISRLKVGAGAVKIPADVQLRLRHIEQTGGYARDRMELAGEESHESRVTSREEG